MKSISSLFKKKAKQEKIVCCTAYDYTMALLIDKVKDIDLVLVGDSASNVFAGNKTTLPITLDEMIYHTKAVRRAVKNSLLIGDLPFLSYQESIPQAVKSAGRLMKEGLVEGIKLEGGQIMSETIARLTQIGIPIMGHIGFTPQSVHMLGYNVQGKDSASATQLKKDALDIQSAGAFAIVLELIPTSLAKEITDSLSIPVIGIGAGMHCDGQIMVCYDLLGMASYDMFKQKPKFVRSYASLDQTIVSAFEHYASDVKNLNFPSEEESY